MKKSLSEINAVLKELSSYVSMAQELEAQIDSLKDEIKEYMKEEDIDELLGDGGQHVIWKTVRSMKFDATAFRKSEFGPLYEKFKKPSETRPFKFFA